jgi:AcrR family transcriptional regulator
LQTFYRHFGSKDELLLAMFEEAIEQGAKPFIDDSAGLSPDESVHHPVTTAPSAHLRHAVAAPAQS